MNTHKPIGKAGGCCGGASVAVSNSNPGPFGFVGWDRSLGPDTPGIAKHGRSREME